jgi:hypothetical protein
MRWRSGRNRRSRWRGGRSRRRSSILARRLTVYVQIAFDLVSKLRGIVGTRNFFDADTERPTMKLLRVLPIQDTANMRDRRKLSESNIDRLRVCIDDVEPNCQSPTDKTFIETGQRENKHLSIS